MARGAIYRRAGVISSRGGARASASRANMWSSACPAAMPPARVVAGARRRAHAPRRVASVVVSGDPARHPPARARHTSALGRRLADANATPLATRARARPSRRASRRAARAWSPPPCASPASAGTSPRPRATTPPRATRTTRACRVRTRGSVTDRRAKSARRRASRRPIRRRGRRPTRTRTNRRGDAPNASARARRARQEPQPRGVVLARPRPPAAARTPRTSSAGPLEVANPTATTAPNSAARRTPKIPPRPRPPPLRPRIGRSGYRINTRVDPGNSRSSVGNAEAEAGTACARASVSWRRWRHSRRTSSRASPRETSAASTTSKMESRSDGGFVSSARGDAGSRYPGADDRDAGDAPASSSDRVRSARRSVHAAVSHSLSNFPPPRSTSPSRNWANAADSIARTRCIFG